jgi:hypothetical protein
MKLVDVNLLIYAVTEESPFHTRAHQWLDASLIGKETFAFSWLVLTSFVRITTHPSLSISPLASDHAINVVEGWLARPASTIVHPTDQHVRIWRDLLNPLGSAGNLVNDAHLAALAIEHGAALYSFDNDFSRFPGLRWKNPLNA